MSLLENLKKLFGLGSSPAGQTASSPAPASPSVVSPSTVPGPPAPQLRETIYRFIVEKLAPYANEAGATPVGLRLWVQGNSPEEEETARVALFAHQPGHFRDELSRHLANHYIQLAPGWQIEWIIGREEPPADCTYRWNNLGLTILRKAAAPTGALQLRVRALTGQTGEADYLLDPAIRTEYYIGRGHTVQTASGRVRTNDIVFVDADDPQFDAGRGDCNLAVSRQHATIRYDPSNRCFRLFADPGGLPANGNKTKIFHPNDTVERVDMPGMGYLLTTGDQIELGGEAKLLVEITGNSRL